MRYPGLFALLLVMSGAAAAADRPKPTLIVAIAVDQYSSDLFNEYRPLYRHGLARLASGAVFPRGYQSHASTETCPGHSTILTGARPARTGIIANEWQDPNRPYKQGNREIFEWYCVDKIDASGAKTVSPETLLVPTLGERLRAADPGSRNVAIAGKDRSALMLAGKDASLTLWWTRRNGFITYADATVEPGMRRRIEAVNKEAKTSYESAYQPKVPKQCAALSRPVAITDSISVGEMKPVPPNSLRWRTTPAFDALTLKLATDAIDELQLGKGKSIDLLAVSFSATDYVGHYFGSQGAEMCAQQIALDETIGKLLAHLDKTGVSYVVALTADHGASDIPERNVPRGIPTAQRIDQSLRPDRLNEVLAKELNLPGPVLLGDRFTTDVWLAPSLDPRQRPLVLDALRRKYAGHPQIERVFTRNELLAAEPPGGSPDEWTLLDRAKASFNPQRSGDIVVMLKPFVTFEGKPRNQENDYAASHGSPWDYDRKVPILFWWPGIAGFEQPAAIETVDIAPTLADLAGLEIAPGEMDGRVLSLGP